MDIKEFFEQSAGKWFSQRTRYDLAFDQSDNSKSEITIELLSHDDPAVIKLCEQSDLNPTVSSGGIKVSWDNSVDWGKPKNTGSTILVSVPDANNLKAGKWLRPRGNGTQPPLRGRYLFGNDEALRLITEDESTYTEERLWFANPNLRMRTSIVKSANGFNSASFYSEIRRITPESSPS